MYSCQALYLKEGIFIVETIKTKSLHFVIVFSLEAIIGHYYDVRIFNVCIMSTQVSIHNFS